MEAVTTHAAVGDRLGQRKGLGDGRLAAVKRRVEAGDLRQRWRTLHQRPDRREIVRLVQRRKRNELLERADHGRVDADRLAVFEPAMNHAVADGDEPMLAEIRAQEGDEMIERPAVPQLHAVAP